MPPGPSATAFDPLQGRIGDAHGSLAVGTATLATGSIRQSNA